MKILHVVPSYLPAWRHGGPIVAIHGLCRALAARKHEVSVFTTNLHADGILDVPTDRPVDLDGVAVRYFAVAPPRRLHRAPAMAAALRDLVPTIDAIHLHSLFLWPTLAAARVAERAARPYFVSPRGMLVRGLVERRGRLRKLLWIRLAEKHTIERAQALVATSSVEAREATAFGLRLPPVVVVPNGIDTAPFRAATPAPPRIAAVLPRQPLVVFLGRLSWKKGLDRLIDAIALVPASTLAIAGNDEEGLTASLERRAEALGIRGRVVFLGAVDLAEKAALLRGATAFALASLGENFGNAVLEAMAAGCPVVVTPEVGLAPTVREAHAGIVAAGHAEAFAAALRGLLDDAPARVAMGRRGAQVALEQFSWEGIAARMEGVYRSPRR